MVNEEIIQLNDSPASLKKAYSWYRTFVENTDEACYIVGTDGRLWDVNPAFEKLYGWKSNEIIGKTLPIIPDHLLEEFKYLQGLGKAGQDVINYQTSRQTRDGTLLHVSLTSLPLRNEEGHIEALAAINKNITNQVEAANRLKIKSEQIKENEKQLRIISDHIQEVLSIYNIPLQKFEYISSSIETLCGIPPQRILENPQSFLDNMYEDDRRVFLNQYKKSARQIIELEYRIFRPDRTIRWVRSRFTPVLEGEQEAQKVIIVTQDITELKEKELLLNKWDKLNAVGQLAAGIAHEIRNPLTTIKGFTQLWGQETHHQFSGIILSELERIEKIMNEFLILAKPHQETKFENKDVNGLLRETVVFMTPEAMLKNVKITTKFTNNLPLVYCEAEQLKQVVINLVKNAFDALPGGGTIRIETSMKDGFVSMRVVDHGVGIPRDRLPRLGEPFFSNKEKGTGLGLMVSFKIIENHNGNINIESEVGKGTTVEVLLPSVQK